MTWPGTAFDWTNAAMVRELLATGADPDARFHAVRNTALHEALWEIDPSAEVVELLVANGADVEAVNESGETPLWCAVRRGCSDAVNVLLSAGAEPWLPVLGGRSAGLMALHGPLADVFASLPGAPVISEEDRARQATADSLIESYRDLHDIAPYLAESMCVAFVGGLDEDEVIRRAGASPADCPLGSDEDYEDAVDSEDGVLWIGTPPGGGVVVYDLTGITPVNSEFCRRVSAGATVASTFDNPAGGDQCVNLWRDNVMVARPSPYGDPGDNDPAEAWLCRFGDHTHDSNDVARNLALMALFTGTHPDPAWLFQAPKRVVRWGT
jgi:hypothetical protein